jgi:large conductance mechanosensitive channel
VRSQRIQGESHHLSLSELVFELTAAVLIGMALYELLFVSVESVIVPFLRGLFGEADPRFLGYVNPSFMSPYLEFNGYLLVYGRVLSVLGTFILAAVVVVLLVAYTRRGTQQAPVEADVETRACPECLSLIPAAARRCAHCRSHVQPQAAPEDTST